MSGVDRHLSPLDQDALRLGGLPIAEADTLQRHLATCPACEQELAARAERAREYGRERLNRGLERLRASVNTRRRAFRLRFLFAALPALAGLALYLTFGMKLSGSGGDPPGTADLAIKGGPSVRVVVRRGDHVFVARDGSWLSPGDAIRFVLSPTGYSYLLVVSVDGAGKTNVYFPFQGAASAPVDSEHPLEVPSGSIVLDDAPGPERVFAVFSREPLESAALRARLQQMVAHGAEAIREETTLGFAGTIETSVLLEKLIEGKRAE